MTESRRHDERSWGEYRFVIGVAGKESGLAEVEDRKRYSAEGIVLVEEGSIAYEMFGLVVEKREEEQNVVDLAKRCQTKLKWVVW